MAFLVRERIERVPNSDNDQQLVVEAGRSSPRIMDYGWRARLGRLLFKAKRIHGETPRVIPSRLERE